MSSFRDVVEMFAQERGVEFLPLAGRFHEGKAVYAFHGALAYLERGVLFVRAQGGGGGGDDEVWRPMTLEEGFAAGEGIRKRKRQRQDNLSQRRRQKQQQQQQQHGRGAAADAVLGDDMDDID